MHAREWLLLLALSVLWGGSFFFAKVALGERGPVWWQDGSSDFNRHPVINTRYAGWLREQDSAP